MDLERRLQKGPLAVRALWSREKTEELPARVLQLRRRRALRKATIAAALLSSAAAWFFLLRGPAGDFDAASQLALQSTKASRVAAGDVVLEDGSRIARLSDASLVQVTEASSSRVVAKLDAGSASFDVHPNPQRAFEVIAGNVRVSVLGTAFTVALEGSQTRVSVTRGKVRVTWADSSAVLVAGEAGLYPPLHATTKPPAAVESLKQEGIEPVARESDWRELAKKGDYAAAYRELSTGSERKPVSEPADLMLAADVARLSNHPQAAVAPLRKVFGEFPGDVRAPLAAFTLGRVLLENLGQAGAAADAFHSAQTLAPSGPLAEDALSREIEARQRAGQHERAKTLAATLAKLYPARHR
jgi:transmembrane sensor